MKRVNNLYPLIYDIDNIELADKKARKCKEKRYGVARHDRNHHKENVDLSNRLIIKYTNLKKEQFPDFHIIQTE